MGAKDIAENEAGLGGGKERGGAAAPGYECPSCGVVSAGPYCTNCGQKHDDMRRSWVLLARDLAEDTFGFDSRMWRTLGLMVARPGHVPANYSHGKRSRYTPPVRFFLVASFVFFLILGVTKTMFVAMEVVDAAHAAEGPGANAPAKLTLSEKDLGIKGVDATTLAACNLQTRLRFFVRPEDLSIDRGAWTRCMDAVQDAAATAIANGDAQIATTSKGKLTQAEASAQVSKWTKAVSAAVENPTAFNDAFNDAMAQVLLVMTPVLALLLTLFIRGRGALFFDHLVLSTYSHAAGFAIVGGAIILAQFGAPNMLPAAMTALFVYAVIALKRAYGRGWIKTVYAAAMAGWLYMVILVAIVSAISVDLVLKS